MTTFPCPTAQECDVLRRLVQGLLTVLLGAGRGQGQEGQEGQQETVLPELGQQEQQEDSEHNEPSVGCRQQHPAWPQHTAS